MNKDQDIEATSDPEGPEYLDADASFIPEVTEYNEVTVEGYIYKANTKKTPDYVMSMYLDVANIDKNDKNTRRKI